MSSQSMTIEQKPYLVRAIFQWIVDNQCTPHLIVASPNRGWVTGLEDSFLQDEFLVLNISPSAAPDCVIDDDGIYFSGRFKGKSCQVGVAMQAVAAMVARENGQGYNFPIPDDLTDGPQQVPAPKRNAQASKRSTSQTGRNEDKSSKPSSSQAKSHLKIIR